jgi:alanyl-tRNA synthetase
MEQLPASVKGLVEERDRLARELKKLQTKELESRVKRLVRQAKPFGPVRMVLTKRAGRKVGGVELANMLKESGPDIVAVVFEVSDKVQVIAAAGDTAVGAGVNAGEIVSIVSRILGGGGGGRPFFATGGGPGKVELEKAMMEAEHVVERQLAAKTAQPVL